MTIELAARAAMGALVDFVLPRTCVCCERLLDSGDKGVVCGRCWVRVRYLPHPQCPRCGHPSNEYECGWCPLVPPFVRAARSVCWVSSGQGAAVVHALKYRGWTVVASAMAERMSRLSFPPDVVEERAALVPVPLASARQRERGFNQSALLARSLGERWRMPAWEHTIERVRATRTQTRLTPEDRRSNVGGAFRSSRGARAELRGRHIILVDDVVTTGATLGACAAALLDGGARIVSFVTFGRARASGDRE